MNIIKLFLPSITHLPCEPVFLRYQSAVVREAFLIHGTVTFPIIKATKYFSTGTSAYHFT